MRLARQTRHIYIAGGRLQFELRAPRQPIAGGSIKFLLSASAFFDWGGPRPREHAHRPSMGFAWLAPAGEREPEPMKFLEFGGCGQSAVLGQSFGWFFWRSSQFYLQKKRGKNRGIRRPLDAHASACVCWASLEKLFFFFHLRRNLLVLFKYCARYERPDLCSDGFGQIFTALSLLYFPLRLCKKYTFQ